MCRGLSQTIVGDAIHETQVIRRKLRVEIPPDFEDQLEGRRILSITRRAKYIIINLSGDLSWIIHLGMSGRVLLRESMPEVTEKHDHVLVELASSRVLIFNDPRRFGLTCVIKSSEIQSDKMFHLLGPEPFSDEFSAEYLLSRFASKSVAIKLAIMDQAVVVGVGNIYASEALFRAKIHPETPANQVPKAKLELLRVEIQKTLEEAIESGGSTLRDYVRSSGDAGYFQHHFRVYDRKGLECLSCKTLISHTRQGGRSTYFCAKCQS